ncbi:MAG: efflux RND transporter periplasmic adaptor subunit [Planctomycetaceae bacterium]
MEQINPTLEVHRSREGAEKSKASPVGMRRPPSHHLRKGLLSLLIIAVISGLCYSASRFIASLKQAPKRVEPVTRVHAVQAYVTERMTVQELITGFGTARAMQSVVLSAQVAGEVIETIEPLKIGHSIRATQVSTTETGLSKRQEGDVILRIDPLTYREKLDRAESMAQEAQAELSRLEQEKLNLQRRFKIQEQNYAEFSKEYNRIKGLVQQNVLSQSNLTTAELDLRRYEDAMVQMETELNLLPDRIKQAESRLATQRNDVELARLDLNRTTITSPISGQFSEVHVERGQYVRVGDPLVTVTNDKQVEVPVGIPMQDYLKLVPHINSGHYPQATLKSAGHESVEWKGLVIRAAPLADSQTRTVDLYIVIDNDENPVPLLPGTFVTVSIDGPIHAGVIPVPRDAVYQDQIFTVEAGKAIQKRIQPVATVESILLVRETLAPGDQIILTNLDILRSGDPVKVYEEGVQSLRDELLRYRLPTLKVLEREPN